MVPGEFRRTTHSHEHMHMSEVTDVAMSGIRLFVHPSDDPVGNKLVPKGPLEMI